MIVGVDSNLLRFAETNVLHLAAIQWYIYFTTQLGGHFPIWLPKTNRCVYKWARLVNKMYLGDDSKCVMVCIN